MEQRRRVAEDRRRDAEKRRNKQEIWGDYASMRQAEVDRLNEELSVCIEAWENLLVDGLDRNGLVVFDLLKAPLDLPRFDPRGFDIKPPAPSREQFLPPAPSLFARVTGLLGAHRRAMAAAEVAYAGAVDEYERGERERLSTLIALQSEYEEDCEQRRSSARRQWADIDELSDEYHSRVPGGIVRFYEIALDRDDLPERFDSGHRVAFVIDSRQLVVEREVPGVEIIPTVARHRYVKARGAIESSARPATQTKASYAALVARFALRTLDLLARASNDGYVDSVVLNCVANATDPATGHSIRPCLVTVRASLEAIRSLDLTKADPVACLRGLGAQVSASAHELRPVRPIVDFNMVDPRFVPSADVLSSLETRPNLAELSPGEFEALITNLFAKMGLETRLTQASRDGGVDCVAWDMRPIVGGKVIVQAKRYRNTVGVSAVRDLYGTVMNEGAAKGILVATSGYGKSAFEFAKNKPIELLPGSQLLFLLKEHAGVEARIEFPDDWNDPLVTE